jgi:tetratricopeptide (TPR) repeat protein
MPEVLQQALDWGLVTADRMPGYLRLQPVLPYFLRTRLNKVPEMKQAVETAYRAHYDGFGSMLTDLMGSKDAKQKQSGQALARLEYENLYTALEMDLKAKGSIFNTDYALSMYLDSTQEQGRGLEIGQMVLAGLEGYSAEVLQGPIGLEMAGVIDGIAIRQLLLKKYAEAEKSYQRALGLHEGLTFLDTKPKAMGRSSIYHQLGMVAQGQRKWQQAEEYYQKALEIKIEFKDRYSQASTYHQLGIVAQEQRKGQQAEEYSQKALEIYIEFNDRYRQAGAYRLLGIVAQEQRKWQQAEEYSQKALEIYIEFKDRYEQAGTYHNLGIVAQVQRKWQQAEEYYQKALEIHIEFKDRYEQGHIYYQLGIMAMDQRKWQQAEEYYQKSLKILIEFNDRYRQAATYHQLGIVAQEQRKWQQAEEYYQKALEICIKFNDRYSQASTYHNLGIVAQEKRQWDIARENLLKSLQIFVEFGDENNGKIALVSLDRLWQATTDRQVPATVSQILGITQEEAEELLGSFRG